MVQAFDSLPCVHTPKLHLLEVDEDAPLPSVAERTLLAELGRTASSKPRWVACVVPMRQARLAMDIVILLSPSAPGRRMQAFSTRAAALAWLLTKRPEAQAPCLRLLRDVRRAGAIEPQHRTRLARAPAARLGAVKALSQ